MLACARGHDSIVHLLLQSGANPDVVMKGYSSKYDKATRYGTPLQAAAYGGHEKVVRFLLDHPAFSRNRAPREAEVIEESDRGKYRYHFGDVQSNDDAPHTPEDLKVQRIDTNIRPVGTALRAACFKGNESIVQMLLDKGADTNVRGGQAWLCSSSRFPWWL